MISKGRESKEYIDISNIRQADIAAYYLNIKSIPCVINSPLRSDTHPSFSLYSNDGINVGYIDFSTGEKGNIISLLSQLWNTSYIDTVKRIKEDLDSNNLNTLQKITKNITIRTKSSGIDIQCKIREWKDYDLEYWNSYGINLKWLKYANVYPISHKIVIKDNKSYAFKADKYAYVYVEFKEGKTTLKIYQPFNKKGFKWANSHDRSVISLWTKIPKTGDRVVICSSLKDALCLWANTNIPALAIQGEGYSISETAINVLKKRFTNIYILLDNDTPGKKDAEKLAKKTGFINLILPELGAKDISDLYKQLQNKQQFKEIILSLFN